MIIISPILAFRNGSEGKYHLVRYGDKERFACGASQDMPYEGILIRDLKEDDCCEDCFSPFLRPPFPPGSLVAGQEGNSSPVVREGGCPKCGGRMEDGLYMRQTYVASWDFRPDEEPHDGQTVNAGGPGILSKCRKCVRCGHSETGRADAMDVDFAG